MTSQQVALRRTGRDGYVAMRRVLGAVDRLFECTDREAAIELKTAVSAALQALHALNAATNAALDSRTLHKE